MATAAIEREPIPVPLQCYGRQRIQTSASHETRVRFYDPRKLEDEGEAVSFRASEMFVQGRMCGDYYVEIITPGVNVAAVAETPAEAAKLAIAKAVCK